MFLYSPIKLTTYSYVIWASMKKYEYGCCLISALVAYANQWDHIMGLWPYINALLYGDYANEANLHTRTEVHGIVTNKNSGNS